MANLPGNYNVVAELASKHVCHFGVTRSLEHPGPSKAGGRMRSDTINEILRRIAATCEDRMRTRAVVAAGNWRAADDDATRGMAFDARVKRD
jgi:hypothetical protein